MSQFTTLLETTTRTHALVESTEQIRGEWWIRDGAVDYADGETGEIDHTGLAIQHATQQVLDALGLEGNGVSILLCDYGDEIAEQFQEEGNEGEGTAEEYVLRILTEAGEGDPADLHSLAMGNGDARDYALKHWGWKRVADNTVETNTLTDDDLSDIASGLSDVIESEGLDDEADPEFNVYVMSGNKWFTGVPYSVLNAGSVAGLREYDQSFVTR